MTVIGQNHRVLTNGAETGQHPTVTIELTVGEAEAVLGYLRNSQPIHQGHPISRAISNLADALSIALGGRRR